MIQPLVSVIIPTTHDRKAFNEEILNCYIRQDYHNKEVLFDYGDGKIGEKLNRLCGRANGEVILRMDSDDKYREDWISRQVQALTESGADITGLKDLFFYDASAREGYEYTYPNGWPPWVAGATACFTKSFWLRHRFRDMQVGEDAYFIWEASPPAKVHAHDYKDGMLASIHSGNTSSRMLQGVEYRRLSQQEEENIRSTFFI